MWVLDRLIMLQLQPAPYYGSPKYTLTHRKLLSILSIREEHTKNRGIGKQIIIVIIDKFRVKVYTYMENTET